MTQEDSCGDDNRARLCSNDVHARRADVVFKRLYDGQDPRTVLNVSIQISEACNAFFRDWQSDINGTDDGPENTATELWWYFDNWLADRRTAIFSGWPFPWLNPDRAEDIWHEFVQLLPTLYVAIIDAILKDPARLDYIERDPATKEETYRVPRRIVDVLPYFVQKDKETLKATPEEAALGRIVWLVAGCGGSWPVVTYHAPVERGTVHKWGPAPD
ncbi:hypothetical protein [Nocardia brasiliensis]